MNVPQNRDAEQSLLGAVLLYCEDRRVLESALLLTEDDFADPAHRHIWQAIKGVLAEGKQIDYSLVAEKLGKNLDKIGGITYLTMLPDKASIPSAVSGVVELLQQKTRERRLWFAADRALKMLQQRVDPDKVTDHILQAIECNRKESNTIKLADVETLGVSKPSYTLALWQVDGVTGGVKPGELMVVAGRTSVGKTMFGIRAALEFAITGANVLYVSLEMPAVDLKVRAQAYLADVPLKRFRQNSLTDSDWAKVLNAEQTYADALNRIAVYVEPAITSGQLMWTVRLAKLSNEADVVIIDHGGRMRPDGNARNEYEAASRIAHGVKNVALKQDVPIIMLWQLSRSVEHRADKKPTLADLRDSGQIEETADIVLLLYRMGYYDKSLPVDQDQVEVHIAKNRAGETAIVTVPWLDFIRRPVERTEFKVDLDSLDEIYQDSKM